LAFSSLCDRVSYISMLLLHLVYHDVGDEEISFADRLWNRLLRGTYGYSISLINNAPRDKRIGCL
jgi:hypothetical protein